MKKKILVAGKNDQVTGAVIRTLATYPEFSADSVNTASKVEKQLDSEKWDVLLICGGFTPQEEEGFYELKKEKFPELILIEHYGGGSGLIYAELKQALNI